KTVAFLVGLTGFWSATVTAAGLASPAAQPHTLFTTTNAVSSSLILSMNWSTESPVVKSSNAWFVSSSRIGWAISFIYASLGFISVNAPFPEFVSRRFQAPLHPALSWQSPSQSEVLHHTGCHPDVP